MLSYPEKFTPLINKLVNLPEDKVAEVADFVEFLTEKEGAKSLSVMASKASEKSFARVWDNPEDAVYDKL